MRCSTHTLDGAPSIAGTRKVFLQPRNNRCWGNVHASYFPAFALHITAQSPPPNRLVSPISCITSVILLDPAPLCVRALACPRGQCLICSFLQKQPIIAAIRFYPARLHFADLIMSPTQCVVSNDLCDSVRPCVGSTPAPRCGFQLSYSCRLGRYPQQPLAYRDRLLYQRTHEGPIPHACRPINACREVRRRSRNYPYIANHR